jgi:hypothetical protein
VWRGTLDRFDGIGLDERTRTVPCTVVVENPIAEGPQGRHALVRGTYVKCRIVIAADQMVDQGKKFVRFPEVAVQPGGYVWLSRDGKLERKPVEIVDHVASETDAGMQDFVVVQLTDTSIQPGERVIVSPMASPVEGTEIRDVARTDAPTPATEPSSTESDSTELSANREGARQ